MSQMCVLLTGWMCCRRRLEAFRGETTAVNRRERMRVFLCVVMLFHADVLEHLNREQPPLIRVDHKHFHPELPFTFYLKLGG